MIGKTHYSNIHFIPFGGLFGCVFSIFSHNVQWPVPLYWVGPLRGPHCISCLISSCASTHSQTLIFAASKSYCSKHVHRRIQPSAKWGMKGHKWHIIRGHRNRGTPFAPAAHASTGLSGLTVPDPSLEESNLRKPASLSSQIHRFSFSLNSPILRHNRVLFSQWIWCQ